MIANLLACLFIKIRIALLMVAILGLTYCDYYGEGFPVHGPLHGYPSHYGTPAIRYKKVPFPYRSGRNLGLGYYGGGYLDPYYGPDRYGPVGYA